MSERSESELVRLFEVMARLRAPGGCPWDRAQTHASLLPYLLEETYETIQAVEEGDPQELAEELGDLLVEVAMHTAIAAEEDGFDLEVVAARATDKMISRHPHVFGEARIDSEEQLLRNWEALKRTEKPRRTSALDGIPLSLPALALAASAQRRAERARLAGGRAPKSSTGLGELVTRLEGMADGGEEDAAALVGEVLWKVVAAAQRLKVDPEGALRRNTRQRMDAYRSREHLPANQSPDGEEG